MNSFLPPTHPAPVGLKCTSDWLREFFRAVIPEDLAGAKAAWAQEATLLKLLTRYAVAQSMEHSQPSVAQAGGCDRYEPIMQNISSSSVGVSPSDLAEGVMSAPKPFPSRNGKFPGNAERAPLGELSCRDKKNFLAAFTKKTFYARK